MTVTSSGDGDVRLSQGEAVFVPASDGRLSAHGTGTIVQADVP
jgi:mannose-6-phosphate isomerase